MFVLVVLGLMVLSAALVVSGNGLRERRSGRLLIALGIGVAVTIVVGGVVLWFNLASLIDD